jgi:hypothetical protein
VGSSKAVGGGKSARKSFNALAAGVNRASLAERVVARHYKKYIIFVPYPRVGQQLWRIWSAFACNAITNAIAIYSALAARSFLMNHQVLSEFLTIYLRLNPRPTDQQFHSLAFAINVDHEELESVAYAMLGDEVGETQNALAGNSAPSENKTSEQQKVLDGDYDPSITSPDNLALNDGAPNRESNSRGVQDATLNDGVAPDDEGLGINSDKSALISDGLPPISLNAALRLAELGG